MDRSSELRRLLGVLRARKWTILVVSAAVMATLMPLFLLQTRLYTAEARILIDSPPAEVGTVPESPNLETEAQLVQSAPVTSGVIDELNLAQSADSLLEGLSVENVTESEVLLLSYTSPNPHEARDIANSFAGNYIAYQQERGLEPLLSIRADIRQQVEELEEQLAQNGADRLAADDASDEALLSRLEADREVLVGRLEKLHQDLDELQLDSSIITVGSEVVRPASLPSSPSSPNLVRDAALSVALALVVGTGAAFLRDHLDDRFRTRIDISEVLHAPVLAVVPKHKLPRRDQGIPAIITVEPTSLASEAYRTLRTSIEFTLPHKGPKILLVASAAEAEGKTLTAVNLSVALAQAGKRVLLVSGDLRRPTLDEYFGPSRASGVSTWLAGQHEDLRNIIQTTEFPNLDFLPSGPIPPNPNELLDSARLGTLMAGIEQRWVWVVVDSAPVLPAADTMVLASHIKHTLLVVNASKTYRSAALQAKERLQTAGTRLVGTVLTELARSSSLDPTMQYASNYEPANGYEESPSPRRDGHYAPRHLSTMPRDIPRRARRDANPRPSD
jgi:capsular exopolysaccharide synthesis family protein